MNFYALDKIQDDLIFDECFTLFNISELSSVQEGLFYNYVNRYWIVKNNCIVRKKVGSFLSHQDFRVLKLHMEDAPKLFKGCEIRLIPFISLRRSH